MAECDGMALGCGVGVECGAQYYSGYVGSEAPSAGIPRSSSSKRVRASPPGRRWARADIAHPGLRGVGRLHLWPKATLGCDACRLVELLVAGLRQPR